MLLSVKELCTDFPMKAGIAHAVDHVSFDIDEGEIVAIVGESGSGKSVTSLSIMGLVAEPGFIASGSIMFDGQEISKLSDREMQDIRGNKMAMIFQEPMTSLNPVYRVGDQIVEAILTHDSNVSKKAARERAIDLLRKVGIPSPEKRVDDYPHQMSGGMRQRVMIAMALSCDPKLLIADEPTTALDVTIQAQILDLLLKLRDDMGMAILLITHDLGVVAEVADRVNVMYCGQIVETADVRSLFEHPKHPYTLGLMKSIPRLDEDRERLFVIEGTVPNLLEMPPGCNFSDRCDLCIYRPYLNGLDMSVCKTHMPELISVDGHEVRCNLYEDENGDLKHDRPSDAAEVYDGIDWKAVDAAIAAEENVPAAHAAVKEVD